MRHTAYDQNKILVLINSVTEPHSVQQGYVFILMTLGVDAVAHCCPS